MPSTALCTSNMSKFLIAYKIDAVRYVSWERCQNHQHTKLASTDFVLLEDFLHKTRLKGVEVGTPSTLHRQMKPATTVS